MNGMGLASRFVLACAALLMAPACHIERAGLAGAGGPSDAGAPADGGRPVDSGRADAGGDGGARDAGPPPVPTDVMTLATSGSHDGHPAVIWDEASHEFVVAFLSGSATGQQVSLARMRPGELPYESGTVSTGTAVPRRSLALAAHEGQIALGWSELAGGVWTLDVRTLDDGPIARYSPLAAGADLDDAQLWWSDDHLLAAVREPDGGGERLASVAFDGSAIYEGVITGGPIGELMAADTGAGPVVASGDRAELWSRREGNWTYVLALGGLTDPLEGGLVELSDGALFAVWSDDRGGSRELATVHLRPEGDGWAQDAPPIYTGWLGPDPAVAQWGDRVVVAWPDETDGRRLLGLAMLDPDGNVLVDRCGVPEGRAVTNDPDIACGAGFCAVVWVEADSYEATDFVTRVLQVPAAPTLVCP